MRLGQVRSPGLKEEHLSCWEVPWWPSVSILWKRCARSEKEIHTHHLLWRAIRLHVPSWLQNAAMWQIWCLQTRWTFCTGFLEKTPGNRWHGRWHQWLQCGSGILEALSAILAHWTHQEWIWCNYNFHHYSWIGMHCHAPNTFGTVNMECTIDSSLSWSEQWVRPM